MQEKGKTSVQWAFDRFYNFINGQLRQKKKRRIFNAKNKNKTYKTEKERQFYGMLCRVVEELNQMEV